MTAGLMDKTFFQNSLTELSFVWDLLTLRFSGEMSRPTLTRRIARDVLANGLTGRTATWAVYRSSNCDSAPAAPHCLPNTACLLCRGLRRQALKTQKESSWDK